MVRNDRNQWPSSAEAAAGKRLARGERRRKKDSPCRPGRGGRRTPRPGRGRRRAERKKGKRRSVEASGFLKWNDWSYHGYPPTPLFLRMEGKQRGYWGMSPM